jgi:uncharacterized repeat protein (TIGR01451 family)
MLFSLQHKLGLILRSFAMDKKVYLTIPILLLIAFAPLLVGSLTISTAAQDASQPGHLRALDAAALDRPANLRSSPEWGGVWEYGPETTFAFTRFDAEYYPMDGKVYFMGGRLASGATDGGIWSYDPLAHSYAYTGVNMPTPISNYTMNLLYDGAGDWGFYTLCGRPDAGGVTPVVQVYYPETNTVAQLDPADNFPGPGSCTSALNVVYENKVYLAGGFDGAVNIATTWVFDPTAPVGSKWTQLTSANLSVARAYIMGGLVDGLIYAVGGNYFDGANLISVATVEVLDPNAPTPTWDDAAVADLPEICSEGRAYSFDTGSPYRDPDNTPLGGKVISSCGGWPDENEHVYVYDTHLDEWEPFPFLQTDRRDHAAAFISDSHPGSLGMPGLWVWGGRQDSDANVLNSSEFYAVNYTGIACNVLLIADDWKFDSEFGGIPYYTSALDELELEYELWETETQGEPEYADMAPFGAVVWFTGYAWQEVILPENETELAAFMNAGGNLLLSSQEYHYEAGYTSFMQNYLGIASIIDDAVELDPVGNSSNPIGDGLGPYAMARPDDYEVYWPTEGFEGPYDDYAFALPGAAEPFRFNASGQPNSTNYDSGTFRSIFLGWPFEWIDTVEERTEIMGAALGWLCAAGAENLDLIPPFQSGDGVPGETVDYSLTLVNNLGYAETFDITYDSLWTMSGPATVGPVPNGGTQAFIVSVTVPVGENCYQNDTGSVTAFAQGDPDINDVAYITTTAQPDGAGSLQGTVYDANAGLGIYQAHVYLELGEENYETWTDNEGNYSFASLPACTYDAKFTAYGYENQYGVPAPVINGMTTDLDATLAAAWPELSADAITFYWPEDSMGQYVLTIGNVGTSDLHFHISDIPDDSIYPVPGGSLTPAAGVDASIFDEMAASPDGMAKFIVYFKEQADLTPAFSMRDREARGQYVFNTLRAVAAQSQAGLKAAFDHQGVRYESRYIANAMVVTGDLPLLNQIAARPEVAFIGVNNVVPAPAPVEMEEASGGITAVAWNILQVNADDVWNDYGVTGEGIVVSNIDTGVQYTHPALVNQYRGNLGTGSYDHNYNWWDPYGDQPLAPYDYHSHGSHTIGTMVGSDGVEEIGMAPDGQWIACNGFKQGGFGYDAELLECAEFILAPWDLTGANPNPDLRPDIVNNSWGGGPSADWWYNQAIYAWRAAGIFPVFSAGNAGPNCSTAGYPGANANVMAVGATNSVDGIAGFSSRGPAQVSGITKPQVSAPGVSVYSAYNNGAYGLMSGTSMAAPHVGGEAALLWSAVPELRGDVQLTYWIIEQNTLQIADGQCGDPAPPNNVYGWGRIDAYDAVSMALSNSWATPWLEIDPTMGVVAPGDEAGVVLTFDTTGLEDGVCYNATLKVEFNDPYVVEVFVPVELCITDVADLEVAKSAAPSPVVKGEQLMYTLTVTNHGPILATGVELVDTLPGSVTFVSASPGCSHVSGVVTCDLGDMASGTNAVITITVMAPSVVGGLINTAQVSSEVFDAHLENNTVTIVTEVVEPPVFKLYLTIVNKN